LGVALNRRSFDAVKARAAGDGHSREMMAHVARELEAAESSVGAIHLPGEKV
jgi:hypothetical protein